MKFNKGILQEMCQSKGWSPPLYSTSQQGPPHIPRFSATVTVHGFTFNTTTQLCSKKEAEHSVAGIALTYFSDTPTKTTQNTPTTQQQHYYLPAPPSQIASNPGLLSCTHKDYQTWNERNSTDGNKGTHEVELILAQERELWQNEKDELEIKNRELENNLHLKSIELEDCHRRLQAMNERATLEQKKVEEWIFRASGEKRENEKLQSKVIELEEHLAKQAVNEEAQEKIQDLERKLKEKEQELTEQADFYSALTFKERSNNDEVQGARRQLIEGLQFDSNIFIGVKSLGDLNLKAFQDAAKKRYLQTEEANARAVELCSMWENYIGDPTWNPFKDIRDEKGNRKEVIDDDDEKLKNLKVQLGHDVYEAVTTALMELNEHNSSGRYKIQELWNFKAGRKATLTEGVSYILKQWKMNGNARKKRRN